MRIKKLFAAALAAGLCFVSAVTPVKADLTSVDLQVDWAEQEGNDFIRFSAMDKDFALEDVYGIEITFTCADMSAGVGGGLAINCDNNSWDGMEWGNDGAGKPITAVETGNANEYTITRLADAPVFQADNTYSNFCLQHYWGGSIVITDAVFLGADGNPLGAASATPEAPAESTDTPAPSLPQTGLVSSIVFLAAGTMISGAGAVVAKGKKEK